MKSSNPPRPRATPPHALLPCFLAALLLLVADPASAQTRRIEITVWHAFGGVSAHAFEALVGEFNASQDRYQVVAQLQGTFPEASRRLVAALAGRAGPVMFHTEMSLLGRLAESGAIRPLDDLIARLDPALIADIAPAAWAAAGWDGRRYALPFSHAPQVLFYNRSRLDARGVSEPRTFDEIVAAARAVTSRFPPVAGLIVVADPWTFETLVFGQGGSLVTPDGRPDLANEVAVSTLDTLRALVQERAAIPRDLGEATFAALDFARGRGAMGLGSLPIWREREDIPVPFDFGVAPAPVSSGGKVPFGGAHLTILARSSEDEAQGAFDFWKFLVEPQRVAQWVEASYDLPIRQAAIPLLDSFYSEDPRRAVPLGQLDLLVPRPLNPGYASWQLALTEALERSLKGNVPAARALQEAQRTALADIGR
jgi:sn-glycerol 3-phosphate transport system substrate-binding protein